MEVIEHLDPERIPALERVVFGFAAPATVVVTTPNAEYNAHFETLPAGALRHRDHRFEWTRAEFRGLGRGGRPGTTATRSASCPSARSTRRTGRPPSWPSSPGRRHDRAQYRRAGHPRAEPGRAGRRDWLGQVHVRPRALQADRGDLLGLLPRPGRRRRERPVRHAGRVRAAAPHRGCPAGRRAPHRDRRDQRAARSPPRARHAGPRARRAAGGDRARPAGEAVRGAQR